MRIRSAPPGPLLPPGILPFDPLLPEGLKGNHPVLVGFLEGFDRKRGTVRTREALEDRSWTAVHAGTDGPRT
eukprot:scaffold772_cov339-Pavlova_lutheri.AAC.26